MEVERERLRLALDTITTSGYTPTDSHPARPTQRDEATHAVLLRLLEEHHLSGATPES
jgi:hypothetical protein